MKEEAPLSATACTRLLQAPAGLGQMAWRGRRPPASASSPRPLAPGLPRGWRWLAGQPTCFPPRCNASPDGRGVLVTAMNQEGLGRKGSAQKSWWACLPHSAWPAAPKAGLPLAEEPEVGRCSALVRHLLLYTIQVRGGRACGRQDALRQRRDVPPLGRNIKAVCGRPSSPPAIRGGCGPTLSGHPGGASEACTGHGEGLGSSRSEPPSTLGTQVHEPRADGIDTPGGRGCASPRAEP